jgi:phosphotransferase system enzyme I (PtsI)
MAVERKSGMEIIKGIPASLGIAIGRAYVLQRQLVEVSRYALKPSQIEGEIKRFKKALRKSRTQLKRVKEKLSLELGREHAYIIDTHLLILKDSMLVDGVTDRIRGEGINAEAALQDVLETVRAVFRNLDDEYMRERDSDVEDVINRIIRNLIGFHDQLKDVPKGVIIISRDLAPSETAQMDTEIVVGFATERGGKTSHTAIMARSLEIPAVVGLEMITRKVVDGDQLILDGNAGILVINPDRETLKEYRKKRKQYIYYETELLKQKEAPAVTTDGHRISLMGNIELPHEVISVLEHGGEGIGLYRTEFLYMNRPDLPSEEEHFRIYKRLAQSLQGRTGVIRTLDLGGDKFLSQIPLPREMNPALGLRAVRLCLSQVDLFKEQIRGALRASHYGNLKIMFPMISGLEELRQVNAILEEAKDELKRAGKPFNEAISSGCMIETPSAVAVSDLLAAETDFFSIGTNDLIQYSLAIDRINQSVAYLYKPLHPAILRNIRLVVQNAQAHNTGVTICGEMAGEPIHSVILVGMGMGELSMNPVAIPRVKKIIRDVSMEEARLMTARAMELLTCQEVEDFVNTEMARRFPDDITPDGRQVCLI